VLLQTITAYCTVAFVCRSFYWHVASQTCFKVRILTGPLIEDEAQLDELEVWCSQLARTPLSAFLRTKELIAPNTALSKVPSSKQTPCAIGFIAEGGGDF
jgi:hypothetical protein